MRSDYGLYAVAIICFLLSAVFAVGMVEGYTLSEAPGITVTVVFLLIGIIAGAVGYSARPKTMMPPEPTLARTPSAPIPAPTTATEETAEPTVPPPPPPAPVEEVAVTPETSSSQPSEASPPASVVPTETAQLTPAEEVTEEKPKRTRRRRKKAAT